MTALQDKILQKHINIDNQPLLEEFEKQSWQPLSAFNSQKQTHYTPDAYKNSFTAAVRGVIAVMRYPTLMDVLFHHVNPHIEQFHDPESLLTDNTLNLLNYGEGDYVTVHDDKGRIVDNNITKEVAYTTLFYLSDVEGGELVLPEYDIVVPCHVGNLITFPAEIKHGVNKVIKGRRYAAMFRHYKKIAE